MSKNVRKFPSSVKAEVTRDDRDIKASDRESRIQWLDPESRSGRGPYVRVSPSNLYVNANAMRLMDCPKYAKVGLDGDTLLIQPCEGLDPKGYMLSSSSGNGTAATIGSTSIARMMHEAGHEAGTYLRDVRWNDTHGWLECRVMEDS